VITEKNKKIPNKAVFFDRDGVLNKLVNNTRPPWDLSEIEIFNESKKIVKLVKKLNYLVIIVTNQPDAERGDVSLNCIYEVNNFIAEQLNIQYKYICIHPYDGMCNCRKPKPGMLFDASNDLGINLSKSFLIGDREKDIKAGKSAGCKTIYLSNTNFSISDYWAKNHYELFAMLEKILI